MMTIETVKLYADAILEERRNGLSPKKLAHKYGITPEYVRQLCNQAALKDKPKRYQCRTRKGVAGS